MQKFLQCLHASIIDANPYMTQEDAISHITTYASYTPINMDKETGMQKKREFYTGCFRKRPFPSLQNKNSKIILTWIYGIQTYLH